MFLQKGEVFSRLPGGRKARAASWAGICPWAVEVTVRSAGGSRGVHGRAGVQCSRRAAGSDFGGHHRESGFFLWKRLESLQRFNRWLEAAVFAFLKQWGPVTPIGKKSLTFNKEFTSMSPMWTEILDNNKLNSPRGTCITWWMSQSYK